MLHKIIFIFCFVLLEQKINWKILEIIEERRVREQYYLDSLNPPYNILKLAGSSSGFKLSEETKKKISKALKGVYTGEKSAQFESFASLHDKLFVWGVHSK